jgi:hypothetical protein
MQQSLEVGDRLHDLSSDAIHEQRIAHCRQEMERSYRLFEKHGDSHHHGVATYWRIEFERAIGKRSPQQIARMEVERGLK